MKDIKELPHDKNPLSLNLLTFKISVKYSNCCWHTGCILWGLGLTGSMADEDVIEAVVQAADQDGHAFDSAVIEQPPLHAKPVCHLSDRALQHRLIGSSHHHVCEIEAYPLEIHPLL